MKNMQWVRCKALWHHGWKPQRLAKEEKNLSHEVICSSHCDLEGLHEKKSDAY
jgi:hypothetical protein